MKEQNLQLPYQCRQDGTPVAIGMNLEKKEDEGPILR